MYEEGGVVREGVGSLAAASKSEIYATHRNKLGPEVAGKAKVSSTWNLQQLLLLAAAATNGKWPTKERRTKNEHSK